MAEYVNHGTIMPDVNPAAFTSMRLNTYVYACRDERDSNYGRGDEEWMRNLVSLKEGNFKKIKGPRRDYYREIYEMTVIEFLTSTCVPVIRKQVIYSR